MMLSFYNYRLPILLLIIIFSPYVFTSVRFDHILLIILSLTLLFRKIPRVSLLSFAFLAMMYFIIIIATVFKILNGYEFAPISPILDSFEWYLRGAIIFLFVSGMRNITNQDLIIISKIYVLSSILIGAIAILQALEINSIFLSELLAFYAPSREGERVLNAINNRYSSILWQPVSYGIFFLFSTSVLFFYGHKIIQSNMIRWFVFLFIFCTSFLSVSKAILIGMPILIFSRIFLAIILLVKLRVEDYLSWFILLSIGMFLTQESNIFASEHLVNTYGSLTSLFDIISYSSNVRFDTDSGQLSSDIKVFIENPLIGIGWSESGKGVHLGDSGYIPILVRSGMLGLLCYFLYLIVVFKNSFYSLKLNFTISNPIVINYLFLFFISLIFAVGTPIFYIDRSADFFWMISGVAIAIRKKPL